MPHQAVLDFWFSENSRPYWFQQSDAFDQTIRAQFATVFQAALANQLADWRSTLHGRVAARLPPICPAALYAQRKPCRAPASPTAVCPLHQ